MSRGIGQTQQAILHALAADENYLPLTVKDLAERLSLPMNQTRRAVRALEGRGRVVITKEQVGWKGEGEYGRLARKGRWPWDKDKPTALTVREGEPIPHKPGYVAIRDVEYYYAGTPTVGLLVWLPENRVKWLDQETVLGPRYSWKDHRGEYERLTASCNESTSTA